MKKTFAIILSSAFFILNSLAQTSIPLTIGVPYQQNFNTLLSSGSANWVDTVTLAGWYADGFAQTLYADDGNDVFGGRLHSYGSSNSSERALGGKSFSSLSGVSFAARMKNNSNNAISYFQISFTGEQWRQNTNNLTLKFYYQINATSITTGTWTPVGAFDFPSLHSGNALALDGNLAVNDTSFLSSFALALNAGQEVWFKWEIIGNSNGPGLAIDDLSITPYVTNPTSISSLSNKNVNISAYPNPSNGNFTINSSEKIAQIEIINVLGEKVYSSQINSEKKDINLSPQPKGVYFVKVQSEGSVYINTIVIQ